MADPEHVPSVLFVCVHNAGRSQMAAAWLTHLSRGSVRVHSAGTDPSGEVEPAAVAVMAEAGVDISAELPKALDAAAVVQADVCVTMGCGDACPVFPGKRYLDWTLQDPSGQDMATVRRIRDEIKALVEGLIRDLVENRHPAAG
ncbi:arsenate reductase ArsC [Streptomyces sp. NPDC001910]|uniref:arsenate reductase ArsC n=1 Tax=Streptomyces sp. NPDC001910 TaxID=3154403 RepID=UPI00331F9A52